MKEFTNAIKSYKVRISEDEILKIFNDLDKDASRYIDYDEFIKKLGSPMKEKGKTVFNRPLIS